MQIIGRIIRSSATERPLLFERVHVLQQCVLEVREPEHVEQFSILLEPILEVFVSKSLHMLIELAKEIRQEIDFSEAELEFD